MTALPTNFDLGPELAEFGLSLASAVLAEAGPGRDKAIERLLMSIRGLRSGIMEVTADLQELRPVLREFEASSDEEKLWALDSFGRAIETQERLIDTIPSLSLEQRVQAARSGSGEIAQEWRKFREDLIAARTLMRQAHIELISIILRHAASWNLPDFSIADDFEDILEAADHSELAQWHETAALLINENASRQLVADANNPPDDFLPYASEGAGSSA